MEPAEVALIADIIEDGLVMFLVLSGAVLLIEVAISVYQWIKRAL